MLQISRQSIKACVSYSDFKVLQKEEKYEENKTNFEGTYLGSGLVDSTLKFGIRSALPRGNLHRKIHVFQFRECRATDV